MRTCCLALALFVALTMSCDNTPTSSPTPSPEPATPPSTQRIRIDAAPPGPPPPTFGEQCTKVGGATCRRTSACSGISADACIEILLAQCCPDGLDQGGCRLPSDYPRRRIDRCADVLSRQRCADRKRNVIPAECDGLIAN